MVFPAFTIAEIAELGNPSFPYLVKIYFFGYISDRDCRDSTSVQVLSTRFSVQDALQQLWDLCPSSRKWQRNHLSSNLRMLVGWLVYIFHSPRTIQNFIMQLWMNAGCEHPESRDLTTTTRLQVGLVLYRLIGHNLFLVVLIVNF